MKKVFILKGLDCPHCSAEIERDVNTLNGVNSASVNLIKQTLTIDAKDSLEKDLFCEVEKIVHSHEPDVEVMENKNTGEKKDKSIKGMIIRLAAGAAIYIAGLALSYIFELPLYAELIILGAAYIILGGDVVLKAVRNILKGRVFDENFLMTVSTLGAFAIREYPEAVAVMLFYQAGEFFQSLAVNKSRKSISDLMDIRPDFANVLRNDTLQTVDPSDVREGEIIVVKPGEKIPLDGVVADGESMLDTRALTGESVPRKIIKGDSALSGCVNGDGVLTIEVTKEFSNSTVSRIIELVEKASDKKAPTENFITTFARYYTPVVVLLAVILGIVPPLFLGGWAGWIRRGLVFLVISCPCALVISIPLTFFGGIGSASKKGVLVKGGNYLEALNKLDTIVFDKTGTLTKGTFTVSKVVPAQGFSEEEVIENAAMAESLSNHPIARSIQKTFKKTIDSSQISDYHELSGMGISASVNEKVIIAGNEKAMESFEIEYAQIQEAGTKVYVAVDKKYAGCIIISDEIKEDSKKAVSGLKKLGIRKIMMLTGDEEKIAKNVSDQLGLDEYCAELLPEQKVQKFEQLRAEQSGGKIAFVGDGINDAPVLARADIGIAMGGLGSDAAIEAADVVLMTDEPSKLIDAVKTARATKKIVMQNIIFALGVKVVFLILGALGIAGMWIAVFGDVGVMLIAVMNAIRILKK